MAAQIICGQNNLLGYTFDVSEKTLAITGCTAFDLVLGSLSSVYNTTTSEDVPKWSLVSCERTVESGLPVFTYTWEQDFPAGMADSDTLLIYLDIPKQFLDYLVLEKVATP